MTTSTGVRSGPLQRHQERIATRRDRAVDDRSTDAVLMLIQLKAADVLVFVIVGEEFGQARFLALARLRGRCS